MRRKAALMLMGVSLLALFAVRFELVSRIFGAETLPLFIKQTVLVEGVVVDDPDRRNTSVRVVVSVAKIDNAEASGKLLVLLPKESAVSYGDVVWLKGRIDAPQTFLTNTGREFDYPNYLRVRGVSAVSYAVLQKREVGGVSVLGALFLVKNKFEASLERYIPKPQVSLLEGMLLGERGGLSQELLQMFVVVGLIHIVVLSGSNISVVSEGVFRGLGFLPRAVRYTLGAVLIVLFALMAGGGAATLRAVIMGGIAVVARYMHRPVLALRALGVAAVMMLLWNPLSIYDNGFVLSVLATFGMITLAPWFEQKITAVPAWARFNLRSIIATTLGVELFILPALLYSSGVLSLVSVPVNALVLPLVPLVMFCGFITGLVGLLHPVLAFLPALVADVLLRALLFATERAATLPFASFVIPPFSGWIVAALYIPLTYLAFRTYMQQSAFRAQTSSDF